MKLFTSIKKQAIEFAEITGEVFEKWRLDGAAQFSAALAYFAIFSIGPLLLISISLAGIFWGQQFVQDDILNQIRTMLGPEAASWLNNILTEIGQFEGSGLVAVIGVITLVYSSLNVFHHLHLTLNRIWGVQLEKADNFWLGLARAVVQRARAFVMVLLIGGLMFLSLTLSTLVTLLQDILSGTIALPTMVLRLANFGTSWLVFSLLIGLAYKWLPDVEIRWQSISLGAGITAFIFILAKDLIGLLIGRMGLSSTYGVAGSAIAFLFWIYISAQIFFLGAELTQVVARRYGENIVPAEGAKRRHQLATQ